MKFNSELQKYIPIEEELNKAQIKHPAWPPNIFEQVAIMNEEAGEVTKAVLHYKREGGSLEDVESELIQTAAMCMRMLINLKTPLKKDSIEKVWKTEPCNHLHTYREDSGKVYCSRCRYPMD